MHDPVVDQLPVNLLEVAEAPRKAPPNDGFRHVVAALLDPRADPRQRNIHRWEITEYDLADELP